MGSPHTRSDAITTEARDSKVGTQFLLYRHSDKEGKEETEVPWRETCRKHNAIQKIIRKAVPGTIIRYHQPRKFIDGYEHDTFTLILVPRGRRTIKGLRGKNGGLYTFDPTGIAEIQLLQPEPALKAA